MAQHVTRLRENDHTENLDEVLRRSSCLFVCDAAHSSAPRFKEEKYTTAQSIWIATTAEWCEGGIYGALCP
jgi:hypothetical protein